MSFNLDDPLAGILSDGSDDSFFDDDILGKKKATKPKPSAVNEKKKSLFDIEPDETKPIPNLPTETKNESSFDFSKPDSFKDSKNTTYEAVSPAPLKKSISKDPFVIKPVQSKTKSNIDLAKSPAKPKISASSDALDILGHLGPVPKEPGKSADKGKSSQSLLDDILGAPSNKQSSNLANKSIIGSQSQEQNLNAIIRHNESKLPSSNKNISNPSKSAKEEPVQTKPKQREDWLGIFNDKDDSEDIGDMPSWLGGETKKKRPSEQEKQKKARNPEEEQHEEKENIVVNVGNISVPEITSKIDSAPMTTVVQSSNDNLAAEGAALYLQQQESQLMVALQLKAQEEKLAAMQLRQKESQRIQKEAALANHDQVDSMLQRQTQHRIQMQAVINAHQERITQRIKELLEIGTNEETNNQGEDYHDGPTDRKESPYSREKKQLLQLVQSLQENHDKEIDLMETSYRRQLAFLEVSLSQSEERMKEESDKLTKFYSEKIAWLEDHHMSYKKLTEDNFKAHNERYKMESSMLSQQHLENVRVLQEHHALLMKNIKSAVNQEHSLMQDASGFSSELHQLVADVKDSKSQCQLLVDKVQTVTENSQRDTDRALLAREAQINDMITQLKTDRENFEREKSDSRDLVNLLEKRLKQMTTMIEDESSNLKQKRMEFEFEKATFAKQTEFAKNVLKNQDDEIKALKEDIQKKYQEKINKINEENIKAEKDSSAIAKEKASIQSLKQELEKIKSELQMQLDEVGEDRLRLNLDKQKMHMEEQRILAKSRNLDMLAKAAIEKQSQADKKYSEAELIQSKYEERIRRIQEHVVSLNAREKQIAKEKVALSRERLSLHNERKKVDNKQCSLCRSAQYIPQYNFDSTFPESFLNVSVSRDHVETNVSSAMNAIANEIVCLKMNKSFDVRRPSNVNTYADKAFIEENVLTTQTTETSSGAYKDYNMDPKFMMLRLDVQQVLNNLDESAKDEIVATDANNREKE